MSNRGEPWQHAVSGGIGGCLAMFLLYPLDQIRILQQVDSNEMKDTTTSSGTSILGLISNIVKKRGVKGMYRGLIPVLISMGISNFCYFFCHHKLSQV